MHGLWYIFIEMTPKMAAKAFWVGELDMDWEDKILDFMQIKIWKTCMDMIEDIRRQSIYPHPESDCETECKLRGISVSACVWLGWFCPMHGVCL